MAVTQAKDNWFRRMFGRDNTTGMGSKPSNEGGSNGSPAGFIPDFLPNYSGAKTITETPVDQNPVVNQDPQPNAMTPADQVETPQSRYKLYELMQDKPERDIEGENVTRNRAKMNAISKGLSGLAGLAGMATGGFAPNVPDFVTPWNMDQLKTMDNDYRRRLEDWTNKGFQVDTMNTQLLNRETDQAIDNENRMALEDRRYQNDAALIDQRAEVALNQLQAKSQTEQIKEMMELGIDPNSKDAYSQYLNAKKKQFNADLAYTNSKTNWNSRQVGRANSQQGTQYPIKTLTAGRNAMIADLNNQLKALTSDQATAMANQAQIKAIQDQISDLNNYNPGKNPLKDAEIANKGYEIESQAVKPKAQQEAMGFPYTPGKGFDSSMMDKPAADESATETTTTTQADTQEVDGVALLRKLKIDESLPLAQREQIFTGMSDQILQNLESFSDEEQAQETAYSIAEDWVSKGYFDELEDAWNFVFVLAQEAANRQ